MSKPLIPDEGAGVGGKGEVWIDHFIVEGAYKIHGILAMPEGVRLPPGGYHAKAYKMAVGEGKDSRPVLTIVVHLDQKASEEEGLEVVDGS